MKFSIVLVLFFAVAVDAWSTFHKSDKVYQNFYEEAALQQKECRDRIPEEICQTYKPFCYNTTGVAETCKKTCGDCPAISPMSCKASRYGCCWDNITTSGPLGADCPACKERSENCRKIKDMCSIAHVRRTCPITCKVEVCMKGVCYDDQNQAEFCPLFKAVGICGVDKVLMKKFCRKTCALCGDDIDVFNKVTRKEAKKDGEEHQVITDKVDDAKLVEKKKKNTSDEKMIDLLKKEVEKELKKAEKKNVASKKEVISKKTLNPDLKQKADEALLSLLLEKNEKNVASKKEIISKKTLNPDLKQKADEALLSLLLQENEKKNAST